MDYRDDKYYVMATVLCDELSPDLSTYFLSHISNTSLEDVFFDHMKEWFFEKLSLELPQEMNFLNLVYYTYEDIIATFEDSSKAYSSLLKEKLNRRDYLFRVIKEEYMGSPKPKNPLYLKNQADKYFSIMETDSSLLRYDNKQDYIDASYREIEQWKKDGDYIFKFRFFSNLDNSRRMSYFITDLELEIVTIITRKYYGKYDGNITSLPEYFVRNPFFSFKPDTKEGELSVEDDRVVSKSVYKYIDEETNSVNVVETIIDEKIGNFTSYDEKEKDYLISQLRNQGALKTSFDVLDTRDEAVLATIYSSFSADSLSEDWVKYKGRSFVGQVLGKSTFRARDVKQVLNSLDKLASTVLRAEQHDESGNLIGRGTLSFFDVRYGIAGNSNSTVSVSLDVANQNQIHYSTSMELPEKILTSNDLMIEIAPSAYLKTIWRERINTEIYTKHYLEIGSSKAKAIMMLIQNERIRLYPQSKLFFSYATLRSRLHLEIKLNVLKRDLSQQLQEMIDKKIIVDSFNFGTSGLTVYLLPFTQLEKILYKIESPDTGEFLIESEEEKESV